MGPFESMVNLIAENLRTDILNPEFVEKLRSDYLMIFRNLPRAKSPGDMARIREGIIRFRNYLEEMFQIDGRENSTGPGSIVPALKAALPMLSASDADEWSRKVSAAAFNFIMVLDIPIEWTERLPTKDQVERHRRRVLDRAGSFWNTLKDCIEHVQMMGGKTITLKTGYDKPEEIAGFRVLLRSYDPDDEGHRNGLRMLGQALDHLRVRAQADFPMILRPCTPYKLRIEFDCSRNISYLGLYDRKGTINICINNHYMNAVQTPRGVSQTIAHEIGHHLYQKCLQQAGRDLWEAAIKSDTEEVAPGTFIAAWPESVRGLLQAVEVIAKANPKLAIQLDTLGSDPNTPMLRKNFIDHFAGHGPVKVPKHPITSYGATNPQEGFCEVIGNIVAYGRRTIDPAILNLFRIVTGTN